MALVGKNGIDTENVYTCLGSPLLQGRMVTEAASLRKICGWKAINISSGSRPKGQQSCKCNTCALQPPLTYLI